jgi:nucleotide-binding universal stress UspA family protein
MALRERPFAREWGRLMYERILVAIDHSAVSERVLAGFVPGSTAHKVIHLADRPVLIVR